jgi:erythromycin esterase-like protein
VNAVAIEGDWSATQRVNLYVRGLGPDRSAEQAMRGFVNFPQWMWPNADFRDFVERLRALNLQRPEGERVGLYGMDVYDLFEAADSAAAYLKRVSPSAGQRARARYRCFARHGRSTRAYGEAARRPERSCRKQAEEVLAEVKRLPETLDPGEREARFAAVRSAASVVAAEEYFRIAYSGSDAWNVRDRRMAQTVEEIAGHVAAITGRPGKVVMWSHNTHSGDARATFAALRGELNLGQLMREKHGDGAFLIGFFSHSGKVFAAPEWDQAGRVYEMKPALAGSSAALFHGLGVPAFSLLIRGRPEVQRALQGPMLERAIGVVYHPHSERLSHYFEAKLAGQFDAIVFFDRTRAVVPLVR